MANDAANALVRSLWVSFRERYAERLQPHWIEVGEALSSSGWGAYGERHTGPRCLVHHDFRPDNMMFGTAAGGRPITVLDWQSVTYGAGATDIAYFLAGALSPDVRREGGGAQLLDRRRQLGHEAACWHMRARRTPR